MTPLAGAGTSASILSVETSTTVSPSETYSPSCLCHSRTVPSVTDSPIWGIWISDRSQPSTDQSMHSLAQDMTVRMRLERALKTALDQATRATR